MHDLADERRSPFCGTCLPSQLRGHLNHSTRDCTGDLAKAAGSYRGVHRSPPFCGIKCFSFSKLKNSPRSCILRRSRIGNSRVRVRSVLNKAGPLIKLRPALP